MVTPGVPFGETDRDEQLRKIAEHNERVEAQRQADEAAKKAQAATAKEAAAAVKAAATAARKAATKAATAARKAATKAAQGKKKGRPTKKKPVKDTTPALRAADIRQALEQGGDYGGLYSIICYSRFIFDLHLRQEINDLWILYFLHIQNFLY